MQAIRRFVRLGATTSALALSLAGTAYAQDATPQDAAEEDTGNVILVTAQRQAQSLQEVPIAVSAFSAEALESQQIDNANDLQLSLPNVTFTKTNFTGSSFTIRGVGDLCVGTSCDAATGIHVNDMPTITRLFETEYFDLERIEVLRGPQGTLFGRNATSGVVNFITRKPTFDGISVSAEAEYGNYNSIKLKGAVNVPIGDNIGVRLAGYYLNRDGFTKDIASGKRVDDRDLYAIRGTLRFEPGPDTTLDIIGYYFHEKDNRNRVGKQLCRRDTSGVLGCAPDRVGFDVANGHATLGGILTNSEVVGPFGWTSRAGPDIYAGIVNPTDLRTINSGYTPTYFAEDKQVQGILTQGLGNMKLTVIGGYTETDIDTSTDYFISRARPVSSFGGIPTFKAVFPVAAARVFDAAGNICVSAPDRSYAGVFGGKVNVCGASPTTADRSAAFAKAWSAEAHLDSDFDGPINFLVGGIYFDVKADSDYFVTSSSFEYAAPILIGPAAGNAVYFGPTFFNSETNKFTLKSYGLFGEVYWDVSDRFKITAGARYSNDKKRVSDRQFLFNFPIPYGTTDALSVPGFAGFDADPAIPGPQPNRLLGAKFDEVTGRLVFDYKVTDDNLVYLSFSRGYKSGGINPPFDPSLFSAPATFQPEIIQAVEIGSKNTFGNGALTLNASAFYYDYKDLQLSRIINRTSFNDNTDAEIYGVELESIIRPVRELTINLSASYLHSKIKNFQLVDTRDPSGGRSDVVIIKDAASASNCVVQPTGNISGATFMTAIGQGAALQPVTGTTALGAFSSCGALLAAIANPPAPLAAAFGVAPGQPLPFAFNRNNAGAPLSLPSGVPFDLSGNKLPQAPTYKFAAGVQYAIEMANGWTLTPRADLTYTGEYFSRSFNRDIDKVKGYEIVNAQIQLDGPDDKWFVRAFVQNLFDNDAITGQYVTDPSSGLFTNVFILEPRRYGIAAGVKF